MYLDDKAFDRKTNAYDTFMHLGIGPATMCAVLGLCFGNLEFIIMSIIGGLAWGMAVSMIMMPIMWLTSLRFGKRPDPPKKKKRIARPVKTSQQILEELKARHPNSWIKYMP